ncbi:MAG: hypothetical protein OXI57_12560 [Rhodospirillales bacterium]|nr:hypothetical protein [Rhodospirillales bacterium]
MTSLRPQGVETAKRYPFPRPGYSFLYVDGDALPLLSLGESLEEAEIEVDGRALPLGALLSRRGIATPLPLSRRTPVLAYGANAAPERLRRKFVPIGGAVFPVLQGRLYDFDVVHAAHISSYGAVPATIEHSPGTVCDIAITLLDERELARMHETELRRHTYLFGLLNNIRLEPDLVPAMHAVSSYVGGFGHIAPDGEALALAAIRAEGRRFRSCSQTEALRTIQVMLGVPGPLDAFIQGAVDDDAIRRARTESLRAQAQRFSYGDFAPSAP